MKKISKYLKLLFTKGKYLYPLYREVKELISILDNLKIKLRVCLEEGSELGNLEEQITKIKKLLHSIRG